MKIIYTQKALSDTDTIFDYITDVIGMRATAAEVVTRIRDSVSELKIFPKRHKIWQSEPWKSCGLRHFSVGNYTVFYRIDETADTIFVERIIYSHRDIDMLL